VLSSFKRYGMAILFLFLVIFLMLMGTLGVKSFGDKMFEDSNITMKPKGNQIKL